MTGKDRIAILLAGAAVAAVPALAIGGGDDRLQI